MEVPEVALSPVTVRVIEILLSDVAQLKATSDPSVTFTDLGISEKTSEETVKSKTLVQTCCTDKKSITYSPVYSRIPTRKHDL